MIKRRNSKLTLEQRIVRLEKLLKLRKTGRKFEGRDSLEDARKEVERLLRRGDLGVSDYYRIKTANNGDHFVVWVEDQDEDDPYRITGTFGVTQDGDGLSLYNMYDDEDVLDVDNAYEEGSGMNAREVVDKIEDIIHEYIEEL